MDKEPRDRFYFDYLADHSRASWASEEGPSDEEIARLFRFLNQWSTHYPSDSAARSHFRESYRQIAPLLPPLDGLALIDAQLDDQLSTGISLRETVREIFEVLANGQRYESTGTAKILHVVNPSLFVMWDNAICFGYAVLGNSREYAYRFLPLMQRELREAVGSFIAEGCCGPAQAVAAIEELGASRPLTKLVDEYNYCKFTLRLPEMWALAPD